MNTLIVIALLSIGITLGFSSAMIITKIINKK